MGFIYLFLNIISHVLFFIYCSVVIIILYFILSKLSSDQTQPTSEEQQNKMQMIHIRCVTSLLFFIKGIQN